MKAARTTANAPSRNPKDEARIDDDGVVRAAGVALVTTFARPEIVRRIDVGDPDAFDDAEAMVYASRKLTKAEAEKIEAQLRREGKIQ